MRFLNSLFDRSSSKFTALIMPDAPFFAVGDIHGCFSLLQKVPDIISGRNMDDAPVVYVGDYVDRGTDSAGVLRWLFERNKVNPDKVICLMGNHERMMLDTIKDPGKHGARWLRYGGMDTVASFGVQPVLGQGEPQDWLAMRDALVTAMGYELVDWIKALPLSWKSGNVFVCHAGAKPLQPLAFQSDHTLLWGSDDFETKIREDDIWVLHGHTIVEEANCTSGRIAVDTGAYRTGTLTCALISEHNAQFLSARAA